MDLIPHKQAVLARLTGPKTLAVLYGFVVSGTFDFYQSGVVTDADADSIKSPGITAHLLLMRELATRAVQEYDFLAGGSFYKEKLATGSRTFVRRRLLRLTPQNVIFLLREAARRAARPLRAAAREKETLIHE
jgi:CelD/BcsL family acetyltransferase involved in cellulose biosynthesis